MVDDMRNQFEKQLQQLNEDLISMGALCKEAVADAMTALLYSDKQARQKAFLTEYEIDHKERDIESLCMKLLLQQQPVARDLRNISAALKMISDMERIGDQAADIAELAKYVADSKLPSKTHLQTMAKETVQMVNESISAFVENDLEKSRKVIEQDDRVDEIFDKIRMELPNLMARSEVEAREGLDILMAGKYLERIGDHAVNIAEWVEYSITGVHKSHEHQLWEENKK